MTKTLYVGNLPWSVTERDLTAFFAPLGEVKSTRIVTDRVTGRSRGFGFVEVAEEDAERIINASNGRNLGGRMLVVNEARPRQSRV